MKRIILTIFILSLAVSSWAATGDPVLIPGSTGMTTVGTVSTGKWNSTILTLPVRNETTRVNSGAMTPRSLSPVVGTLYYGNTTYGAADYLQFGSTTELQATFRLALGRGWDHNRTWARFQWTPASANGTVGQTVNWRICSYSVENGTGFNATLRGCYSQNDTVKSGKNSIIHRTPWFRFYVKGAEPGKGYGDTIFVVSRNVTSSNTYSAGIRLLDVDINAFQNRTR